MTHEELHTRARVEVGFGLAWMLLDRANTFVRTDSVWPPNLSPRVVDMRKKNTRELVSMFGVSEDVASAALEEAKGDISDATVLLMDESSRRRLEAQTQNAHKQAAPSSPGGALNAAQRMYQRLREIFPSASELELRNAVEASGGCQEVAEDILLDHCGKYTESLLCVAQPHWKTSRRLDLMTLGCYPRPTDAAQTKQHRAGDDGRRD